MRLLGLLTLLAVPAFAGPGNLLAGKLPIRVEGISDPERMTDGVAAPDGDEWKSTRTSIISPNGFAIWDLGEEKPIRAALLQGDNNDDYLLEGSIDNVTWSVLWRVHTVGVPGLQLRTIRTLEQPARYIRLTARNGDGSFSVSEVELHATPDTLTDATVVRKRGRNDEQLPWLLWLATIAGIAYLVQSKQKMLWVLSAPLLAAFIWASATSLLDRFVGE
jgi:hypothetical protein